MTMDVCTISLVAILFFGLIMIGISTKILIAIKIERKIIELPDEKDLPQETGKPID